MVDFADDLEKNVQIVWIAVKFLRMGRNLRKGFSQEVRARFNSFSILLVVCFNQLFLTGHRTILGRSH